MLVMIHYHISKVRGTYSRGRGGGKDESTEVGGALVAESAGGVDEGTDTVRLESRADERRTPGDSGGRGLLGAGELLLGVGRLGALVGGAEDGCEDGELNTVVEDGAEGDSRRLDGGEVWLMTVSIWH